ncbi:chemotaxis protein CheB (plasmid) [Novosphingobium sp. BL-8A]|uniref:chemotaxis protein CheB n=1 Tax=Novosphingobium sp. BL-8A TaxID=3127639 RepID=UPI0037576E60
MTPNPVEAVVIGASAGAVQALLEILPALPETYPLPILIVVHIPPDRASALPDLFAARCRLPVKEAEDKEIALPGVVYFAPADYHLLVESGGSLALSVDDPVNYSRPAIDVLFESAADAFGAALAGIVLTGANHDGAAGLKAIAEAGGLAIVEDPASAASAALPAAALAACPTAMVLDLPGILDIMQRLTSHE